MPIPEKKNFPSVVLAIMFIFFVSLQYNCYSNISSKFIAKFNELASLIRGTVRKCSYDTVELEGMYKGYKIKIRNDQYVRGISQLSFFVAARNRAHFALHIDRKTFTTMMTDMAVPYELKALNTGDVKFDKNYEIISPDSPNARILALNYVKQEKVRKFINDFSKNEIEGSYGLDLFEINLSGITARKTGYNTELLENLNNESVLEILNNLISIIPEEEPVGVSDGS